MAINAMPVVSSQTTASAERPSPKTRPAVGVAGQAKRHDER